MINPRFAKAIARARPSWNVHPLTRDPSILAAHSNPNKNLASLILEAFDGPEITKMVKNKTLFAELTPTLKRHIMISSLELAYSAF